MSTNELRAGLPPLPPKMRGLPIDKRGFPVPFFVAMVNGEPDHRVVEPRALQTCVRQNRCWICGNTLGAYKAFVLGPMCAINRISAEPPCHLECAQYAATACPFLTRPHAKRREAGMPEERSAPGGIMLTRNPGVCLVWVTKSFRPMRAQGGIVFQIGDADSMHWYAEGRAAVREEIEESISGGLPHLVEMAHKDADPDGSLREINYRAHVLQRALDKHFGTTSTL